MLGQNLGSLAVTSIDDLAHLFVNGARRFVGHGLRWLRCGAAQKYFFTALVVHQRAQALG